MTAAEREQQRANNQLVSALAHEFQERGEFALFNKLASLLQQHHITPDILRWHLNNTDDQGRRFEMPHRSCY